MLYLGCDVHRDYTTISCVDEAGVVVETNNVANSREGIGQFLARYPEEEFSVVLEAGFNWGMVYDLFESLARVDRVVLAHPPKVKAIASAQIKTDKIDAPVLARLLRVKMIPEVWISSKEVRVLKDMVRFRAFVVKVNTMVKNRIHDLLQKAHVTPPAVKDLFGSYGRQWLTEIALPDARSDQLLRQHLALHDTFKAQEHALRKWVVQELKDRPQLRLLMSIPGIGEVFAAVILLEIDDIHRFPDAAHLHAYCGLVPSTHSSGRTQYHGRLIRGNKWLRWAFVEGAHTSVRVSPYFRRHYNRVKMRAGTQAASIACARKLATVSYAVLREQRPYYESTDSHKKGRLPSVKSSQVTLGSGLE
jgi:transposase